MEKDLKNTSILMLGFDQGLLGLGSSGDAIARHVKYAQGLKRLDIIIFTRSDIKENKIADNCTVYGIGHGIKAIFKSWQLAQDLYNKYHYDIFDMQDPHITGFIGLMLKNKFHNKLEIHFHGDFWQNNIWLKESFKNKFYNILQKIVVPRADAVRVVNRGIKNKLISSGIKENIIAVINTPVNQDQFQKNIDQTELDNIIKKYNKKILLFVGRLVPAKNIPFLLKIIKKMSDSRQDFVLLLIGEGEQANFLSQEIKNLAMADFVFLLGAKKHEDLLAYYKAAYLNILLSTNESFGKVIIEAGLAGLPSLASRTLGPESIIEDGQSGWLVDINDLENTTKKLSDLLDDPSLVLETGQRAKHEFAANYSRSQTFEKVKSFWYRIVNNQL